MGNKNGKHYLGSDEAQAISEASGMAVEEVQEKFSDFCSEFPNGKMKREHLRKLLGRALPSQAVKNMEKHVFKIFDDDNDGFIDFAEFLPIFFLGYGAVSKYNEDVPQCPIARAAYYKEREENGRKASHVYEKECDMYLRKVFHAFDPNKQGWVSDTELIKLVQDMAKYTLPDKSPEELSNQAIKAAFDQADLDNDGRLTVDEFVTVCRGEGGHLNILTELVSGLSYLLEDIGLKPTERDYIEG